MKYTNKILLLMGFIFIASSCLQAAQFFTAKGSAQLGGSFSFKSTGYEHDQYRKNELYLSPEINFFPINFLLVGPSMKIYTEKRIYDNSNSTNSWVSLGGKIGFAYGKQIPVIPYIHGSPQILIYNEETGFGTELNGGIIVPVQKHFSINFGTGFWFEVVDNFHSHTFFCAIGITGLVF